MAHVKFASKEIVVPITKIGHRHVGDHVAKHDPKVYQCGNCGQHLPNVRTVADIKHHLANACFARTLTCADIEGPQCTDCGGYFRDLALHKRTGCRGVTQCESSQHVGGRTVCSAQTVHGTDGKTRCKNCAELNARREDENVQLKQQLAMLEQKIALQCRVVVQGRL